MTVQHTLEVQGKLLRVKASGKNGGLAEMTDYSLAVLEAAEAAGCTLILCDETELACSLNTFDVFEVGRLMAERARRALKVAVVCPPQRIDLNEFWETVVVNRGLEAKVFLDVKDAEQWLHPPDAAIA